MTFAAYQWPDAGATSSVPSAITSTSATSVTVQTGANFPAVVTGFKYGALITDNGNPAYSAASPLATPYEGIDITGVSGNVLTVVRGQYGTTGKTFFAGAQVAAVLWGEAMAASFPHKFAELTPSGAWFTVSNLPASGWNTVRLRGMLRTNSGNATDFVYMQVNGITTATYDTEGIAVTGGTVSGVNSANANQIRCGITTGGGANANCFGDFTAEIMGYALGSSAQRMVQTRVGAANTNVALYSEQNMGHWQATTAISSIKVYGSSGTDWATGSFLIAELLP